MQVQYRVNGVSSHQVDADVDFQGETVQAKVSELQVELVDTAGVQGSLILRVRRKADIDAARAKYVPGETVTVEF